MCWSNNILIPIVLKKPLRVYKIGTSTNLGNFISLYRNTMYLKYVTKPTIKINPEFVRLNPRIGFLNELWEYDRFDINEGYHSYLTKGMAEYRKGNDVIGIFIIPADATIYVNYKCKEVVSTDIEYLGLLEW